MKNGIIFSGKAGVGKDTVGLAVLELAKNKGYNVFQYAFADALKEYSSKTYGYPNELNYSQEGKSFVVPKFNKTVRKLLNEVSKIKKKEKMTYWVDIILNKIKTEKYDLFIITDSRFLYEMEPFKKEGAFLVRINTDSKTRIQRGVDIDTINSNDESEIELDNYEFDKTYENSNKTDIKELASIIWNDYLEKIEE